MLHLPETGPSANAAATQLRPFGAGSAIDPNPATQSLFLSTRKRTFIQFPLPSTTRLSGNLMPTRRPVGRRAIGRGEDQGGYAPQMPLTPSGVVTMTDLPVSAAAWTRFTFQRIARD